MQCCPAHQRPPVADMSVPYARHHFQVHRTDAIGMCAGLHGAKVAIMGRRQQVIQDSAEKLKSEGVDAIGVQVL